MYMVCIAAFIILCVIGLFVAFLSIFKKDLGRRYWTVFKKAWGCVGKKVRLQKCETNFKDDVKNSLLRKIVLKHPKWIKPVSVVIEILAIIIVVIAVWSIVEVVKALLALWTLGSCNVSKPSACSLTSVTCSVDAEEPKNPIEGVGRWFEEWGEIFQAVPDKLREWNAKDYIVEPAVLANTETTQPVANLPYALDVIDPGCSACMQSYRNQLYSGFFNNHNVVLMVYPIQLTDGSYKFPNSELIARYFYATAMTDKTAASKIIKRLFAESDQSGVNYQTLFLHQYNSESAEKTLKNWLVDFGLSSEQVSVITKTTTTDQVTQILAQVRDTVENRIRAKGIPLLIYDGKIHLGLYEAKHE